MGLKLSKEEQYGIMALVDLSKSFNNGSSRVKAIAERQEIPTRFLEQIFSKLRQANIVIGKRGPAGGYTLSTSPEEISLGDIINALRPTSTDSGSETAVHGLAGVVSNVWQEVEDSFQQTLNQVSLATLRDRVVTEEVGTSEQTSTDTDNTGFVSGM